VQPAAQKLYSIIEDSLRAGNMAQAIAACREINTRFPDCFEGWLIAGEIHTRMRKPEALLVSTDRALSLRPGDPEALIQKLEALIGTENLPFALEVLRELAQMDLGAASRHDRVGRHMAILDMHEEAKEQFVRSLTYEPDNAALLFNLATEQRFTGEIDAAEKSLDRALAVEPHDFEAHAMRSSLKKQTHASNHIVELQELLDDVELPDGGEPSICYALAKEYDDIDDPASSFRFLKRGADSRRRRMNYSVADDVRIIEKIKATFDKSYFDDREPGHHSEEPIFILGLPRTGTTLVERILGSHSAVHAAGELDNFGREMLRLIEASADGEALSRYRVIEHSAKLDVAALGRAYVESTRPITGHTPRFIDKLPFNYLYAGLIHKALPKARIINLARNPVASCYSMYKQLFRDPYPFSYDLDDLATYFLAYRDLLAHWHKVIPGAIHTVEYENLVKDTEGETRRLLAYCGLEWEDDCLRFYENRQASTTASASQVRQPVYSRSLERWKLYEEYLAPLEQRLNDAGVTTRD
jgi:tetratricopeptide (TPR) repeat protein